VGAGSQGPLVSIVTPSYHQSRYIADTIRSVLQQDYPNLEYLVMDGGSTDGTAEILQQYGDRLVWFSEKDGGQADAINKGLGMARGEILGWLNSDDTYEPGAIGKIVQYFETHPEVGLVYGEGILVDAEGQRIGRYPTEPFDAQRLSEVCFICQPTVFFRADVFRQAGPLDANLKYCLDYEYWIRVARQYHIGYLNAELATSRLHARTKTLAKRLEMHDEILRVVKHHYGRVSAHWLSTWAYFFLVEKLMPNLYGVDKNGWASQKVRIFLPDGWERYPYLALQGSCTARAVPLSLCVAVGGRVLYKTSVQQGRFALRQRIMEDVTWASGLQRDEVELYAEPPLTAQGSVAARDFQPPFYRVRRLAWCDEQGREVIVFTAGRAWLFAVALPVLFLWKSLLINRSISYQDLWRHRRELGRYLRGKNREVAAQERTLTVG
jgi:glycosyltransferase involved in cell wall biosynthesis